MPGAGDLFDFSDRQFKLLIILGSTALLLTVTLVAQRWLLPPSTSNSLPLIIGDQPADLPGIFVLDPNRSPVDSLELLPGIGPVLAARIAAHRTDHPFDSLDDLKNVNGINDKLLEKLSPYLRIHR